MDRAEKKLRLKVMAFSSVRLIVAAARVCRRACVVNIKPDRQNGSGAAAMKKPDFCVLLTN